MKTDKTGAGRLFPRRPAGAALFVLLVLITIPARIPALRSSLWLDESWVANSVLMPSLSGTFHYPNWVQSSPPLFLALERLAVTIGGPAETTLRMPSLIASLAALWIMTWVLRKWFTPAAAFLGTAMLAANYTQLKYGQELKQYSADMLVAALLTWIMARALKTEERSIWKLRIVASIAPFLSFPSVFFLPPVIILMTMKAGVAGWHNRFAALIRNAALPAISLAINYLLFIRQNRTPELLHYWQGTFVDPRSPSKAVTSILESVGALLIPNSLPGGSALGVAMALGLTAPLLLAVHDALRARTVAQFVALAGVAPLVVSFGAACFSLYPILWTTRMLIWALPACALLSGFALDRIFERLIHARWLAPACAGLAFAAVIASQIVVLSNPRPIENNREAVETLRERMRPGDCLYVHGSLSEPFFFYSKQNQWAPPCLYLGNTDWPCCARNVQTRVSDPAVDDIKAELVHTARKALHHRLMLLIPTGADGHWSKLVFQQVRKVPDALREAGCADVEEMFFGGTKLVTCSLHSIEDRKIVPAQ